MSIRNAKESKLEQSLNESIKSTITKSNIKINGSQLHFKSALEMLIDKSKSNFDLKKSIKTTRNIGNGLSDYSQTLGLDRSKSPIVTIAENALTRCNYILPKRNFTNNKNLDKSTSRVNSSIKNNFFAYGYK